MWAPLGDGAHIRSGSLFSRLAYLLATVIGPAVPPTVDSIQMVPGLVVPAAAFRKRRLNTPPVAGAGAAVTAARPTTGPVALPR